MSKDQWIVEHELIMQNFVDGVYSRKQTIAALICHGFTTGAAENEVALCDEPQSQQKDTDQ